MYSIRDFATPADFLSACGPWLERDEARHNLILSLASGRASADSWEDGAVFWGVTFGQEIVGCVMRTPPHKLLVTAMPEGAAIVVAEAAAEQYAEIPAVLGPRQVGERIAERWSELRGGGWQIGMGQGVYRLDSVIPPERPAAGEMRVAGPADVDRAFDWGLDFSRDTGVAFPTKRETVESWVERGRLHLWVDGGEVVSMAVAHGFTGSGSRIGFVFTPRELRGRGYASVLVAELSQAQLDAGRGFCVLYTDLGNPTSNAIYQRVGYELVEEVVDVLLVPEVDE